MQPQIERLDDLRFDLAGVTAAEHSKSDEGCGKTAQLILERAYLTPAIEAAYPLHESRQARLDLNVRRSLPQRLSIEMRQDQARLGPPRQANVNEGLFLGISEPTGLH